MQALQLRAREPGRAVLTAQSLDLGDSAMLVLGAERHEDRTGQGEGDAEQKSGILEDSDELIAHVFHHSGRVPHHPSTLPAGLSD